MNNGLKLFSGFAAMTPRNPDDAHRAATPLELLFDLVSVIAIASAAVGLHHGLAEAHYAEGIIPYVAVFFPIWWAWMNYTWFASAYDNDDTLFRLLTMLIMAGALTMAAGVSYFFKSNELALIVAGFVVMRIGMVALWLRAASDDPERRTTCLTYAVGLILAQAYWVGLLVFQPASSGAFFLLFGLGVAIELTVPALAERQGMTPWHRHHIIERYGLLNIIVLGETLLAGSMALAQIGEGQFRAAHVHIALSTIVILFAMWWTYFAKEEHLQHKTLFSAFSWGYGHFFIYLAGAATGAGFACLVDIVSGHAEAPLLVGDYAVAVPVAIYFLGIWFVRDRVALSAPAVWVLPAFAGLILVVPLLFGLEGIAAVAALTVYVRGKFACGDDW
ncbi:low temperature requirement protein A [Halomonas kalidii]|uniref:Low temperature requirement protein A n=1 Tax=Halomonas kalidii TaxID=3043293 RepID=A0ABT6VHD7_9GAMM|nr:low temperature requirement protein A [Halomonas kalidii]MDI5933391.1 low temperature requirement protein A [Halomonas kalidii]